MWNKRFRKETAFVIFGNPWKIPEGVKDIKDVKRTI